MTAFLSGLALTIAVAALTLAIVVARQNAEALTLIRRHRRAHHDAEGYADPEPLDAPATPPAGAHRWEPHTITVDEPLTPEQANAIRDNPPGLPTAAMPAARPLPPVDRADYDAQIQRNQEAIRLEHLARPFDPTDPAATVESPEARP